MEAKNKRIEQKKDIHENIVEEVSEDVVTFFSDIFKINKEFTYDELENKMQTTGIDDATRKEIESFFEKMLKMQSNGGNSAKDAEELREHASSIIQKVSRHVRESRKKPSGFKYFFKKAFGRIEKTMEKKKKKTPAKSSPKVTCLSQRDSTCRKATLYRQQKLTKPTSSQSLKESLQKIPRDFHLMNISGKIHIHGIKRPHHVKTDLLKDKPKSEESELIASNTGEITSEIKTLAGKHIRLNGMITYVNTIPGTSDHWYMFKDKHGEVVALSKVKKDLSGKGVLSGMVRKTATNEPFVIIENFEVSKKN